MNRVCWRLTVVYIEEGQVHSHENKQGVLEFDRSVYRERDLIKSAENEKGVW